MQKVTGGMKKVTGGMKKVTGGMKKVTGGMKKVKGGADDTTDVGSAEVISNEPEPTELASAELASAELAKTADNKDDSSSAEKKCYMVSTDADGTVSVRPVDVSNGGKKKRRKTNKKKNSRKGNKNVSKFTRRYRKLRK